MRQFKKGDSEYITNGHYEIDGVMFMSIWMFKNEYGIDPSTNNPEMNSVEGTDLVQHGISYHDSIPDIGNTGSVYLYPVTDLEDYYNV